VGWWVSSRAIRPIRDISATAEKIAGGDLSQRIKSRGFASELQTLARVLNSTFSRLDAAFTQQAHFTADAAHELRTPVSVMLMHAQNGLACEGLTEEQRESFEACQRAAQRMRRLIESLLQLARLDAGEETLKHDRFDLAGTAQDCVALVQPLAEKRGVQIFQDIDAVAAMGDSDRVAQVITNLLTNAIEYNQLHGQVNVKLHRENGSTILTVTDTGHGITPADLPHVFERFYRADTSRSSTHSNGLGLAISKAIVEAQGGTLAADSPPGQGATFTMRLPSAEKHG
jgi:heavy metal sensor kinase